MAAKKKSPPNRGKKFAIGAMSFDQVGIVSNVTGAVAELGGNIDKISQTVVDGCFTIVLTAVFPPGVNRETLKERLDTNGARLGLDVSVREYQSPKKARKGAIYFLTVTGRDQKGIFHAITNCLAGHYINITDLYCFIRPVNNEEFVLIGEISVPDDQDLSQVLIDLEELGKSVQLTARIQHEDLFRATNDLYISRPENKE